VDTTMDEMDEIRYTVTRQHRFRLMLPSKRRIVLLSPLSPRQELGREALAFRAGGFGVVVLSEKVLCTECRVRRGEDTRGSIISPRQNGKANGMVAEGVRSRNDSATPGKRKSDETKRQQDRKEKKRHDDDTKETEKQQLKRCKR
jgi:hypothetical protein